MSSQSAKPDPAQVRQWVQESRAKQGLPAHASQDQYDRASIIIRGWMSRTDVKGS